jgi:membrane-associated protein
METLKNLILHLNFDTLAQIINTYRGWTYLILFAVIFCETGLVVTPFLPGDSLLFLAGAVVTAKPECNLSVTTLFVVLSTAAIVGDNVNYWIGAYVGPRAFTGKVRFLKKEYLDRTHRFFERYGGKAVVLARFVPIVRTFMPFVAGIGRMHYAKFLAYDVPGGLAWVGIFVFGGHWLGQYQLVRAHPDVIVPVIILISVMPMLVEFLRARMARRQGGGPQNAGRPNPDA